jgi:hypothetical protein
VNKTNSRIPGLPSVLRLAGKRLHVCYSFATPPSLPEHATLLRRTRDRSGRIASRYWQTSHRGRYRLLWPDTGAFDLDARHGNVTCFLVRGSSRGAVEEILRGPVCAFFLLENGFEPLHAGAVSLDGRCLVFAGTPGAGKSSLVAWMSRHGARFLCDDILPLRRQGRAVWGHPGLAQLRLEPPGARKLGWRETRGLKREPGEKSKFAVVASRGPRRVARIYLLERGPGESVEIRRLEPRRAFRALLKSTRNDSLDTPERLRRQMRLFAHLARTVPVCRLRYPRRFAALPAVLARIRQDLWSAVL